MIEVVCPNCKELLVITTAPPTPKTIENTYADMVNSICIAAWDKVLCTSN